MTYLLSAKTNSTILKNKAKLVMAVFILQALTVPILIRAEVQPDSTEVLFERVNNLCHAQGFEQSIAIALDIRQQFPDSPVGVFALLKNYQSIDSNYRVKLFETKVDSLLDIAIELAKKALKNDRKNGRNYFYAGTAYGFKSLFSAQHNRWVDAFKAGTKISRNLNRAVTLEPKFYDAYYGLGLNNYWLNAKGPLRYLPNARKNRNLGIEYIKLVIEKGTHSKTDAMFGLAAIYIHEEEYDRALELYLELFKQLPQNPNISYRMGKIYEVQKNWRDAFNSYTILLDLLDNTPYKSYSYKVECLYSLAKCNYEMKKLVKAKRLCQEAIAIWPLCDFDKELEGPYETFSEILNGLNNLSKVLKEVNTTQVSETN